MVIFVVIVKSMISCSNCGHYISKNALKCPKCNHSTSLGKMIEDRERKRGEFKCKICGHKLSKELHIHVSRISSVHNGKTIHSRNVIQHPCTNCGEPKPKSWWIPAEPPAPLDVAAKIVIVCIVGALLFLLFLTYLAFTI